MADRDYFFPTTINYLEFAMIPYYNTRHSKKRTLDDAFDVHDIKREPSSGQEE
jgi:hypothetical protein